MKWYKHDTDAINDAKLKKLVIRHGAEGYAIYFHCLELIAASVSDTNITFELEHDSEIIADNLRIKGTPEHSGIDRVEEIMRYIIELGLFESDGKRITCFKMLKRLDTSMTSNKRMRSLIGAAKENHDKVMTISCKKRREETRREETRREEKRKDHHDFLPPSSQKVDLDKILQYWNTLSPPLPRYRYTIMNLSNIDGIGLTISAYTQEEITQAVKNYSEIVGDKDHYKPMPEYGGLPGFLAKGVEKYADDAYPFDRCKIVTFEDVREKREAERQAEIDAQIEKELAQVKVKEVVEDDF